MLEPGHVYCMDATALLSQLPTDSVDLIATDPPYGIGYASSWTTRSDGAPRNFNGTFGADVFNADWLPEAARVLKSSGALYLCTRWDVIHLWQNAIESAGLHVVQRIVWDKCHWGMGDLRYFGSQTEDILFCVKGEHHLRWPQREGNLWRTPNGKPMAGRDGYFDNPTQKPTELMVRMIELSTDKGDLVVDPCCGSGTTLVSAAKLGRQFIGGDIDEYQFGIASRRLANWRRDGDIEVAPGVHQLGLFA